MPLLNELEDAEWEGDLIPAILIKQCDSTSASYVRVGRGIVPFPEALEQLLPLPIGVFKVM